MESALPLVSVVEDDQEMRESLVWVLESRGLRVEASAAPSEFFQRYDPEQTGCIVLDLQLPEMTGLEICERLRSRGDRRPFIIITAFASVRYAIAAVRIGAIDFLEKPFSHEDLLARVNQALEIDSAFWRAQRELRSCRARLGALSEREKQVADLVAAGKASKAIARELSVAVKTVEVHRRNVLRKLNAASSAEVAALVARQRVLTEFPPSAWPHSVPHSADTACH